MKTLKEASLQSEFIYCRNKDEALVKKNNLYKRNDKKNKKYLAPVRPDRKYQRNMKPKSAIPFNTKAS